ncbi:hypothetical protein ACQ86N_16910 [Puia sp. P3]|uniref:hypothetical protein n=1 Tax=Puia sp. P3 TaxID=3423952 RepID=UPI003D668254
MKHLKAVNKYFWKYRWRFLLGLIFVILSNYFRILTPRSPAMSSTPSNGNCRYRPAKRPPTG